MLQRPAIADVGEAQVDLDRHRRCGFPEVVFAQGKTVAAMEKIFRALVGARGRRAGHADVGGAGGRTAARSSPTARYNPVGRTFRIPLGAEPTATAADGQSRRDAGQAA